MSKASPILTSFNSGEFSPFLDGRVDFDRYSSACRRMENMIPSVQGPALRRGGTRFVDTAMPPGQAPLPGGTGRVYLQPFQFSEDQAYILEIGHHYIWFCTQNGRLKHPDGTRVGVQTPYSESDIFAPDGTCRLRFAQSGDVLWIVHPRHEPRVLRRLTPTSFDLVPYRPKGGPFEDVDPDQTITVSFSGSSGVVAVTASSAIFTPGMVGSLFYVESSGDVPIPAWEAGKRVASPNQNTLGILRQSDGKVYACVTDYTVPDAAAGGREARTGTQKPVHTRGVVADGDGNPVTSIDGAGAEVVFANRAGLDWLYLHSGYGWIRIDAVSPDGLSASGEVLQRLPDEVVHPNTTTRWAKGAWSSDSGWPSAVTFFRERLVFARGQRLWFSVAGGFDDFSARNDSGEIAADQAISLEIASGEINEITWLHSDRDLVAGTAGGEFTVGELQNGDPLGPGNVRVQLVSRFGGRGIQPVGYGNVALFAMRSGLKVREIAFDFSSDGYQSRDMTTFAEHITQTGVVDMDIAVEPWSTVWMCTNAGALIGFTWNNEENVRAWHRHPMGGGALVESIAVIPRPDGSGDQVWLCKRLPWIQQRYIEILEEPFIRGDERDQFYVDSGLSYSGPPVTTLSGLDHLEGLPVEVLADGATHPPVTVSGGQITLVRPTSVCHVGLKYRPVIETMRMEAGASDGTSQGKTKRIHKIVLRLGNSGSIKIGPNEANLQQIEFRTSFAPMDQAVPLFTGDWIMSWPSGYETDARIFLTCDLPVGFNIISIMPQIVTQDAR